MVDMLINTTKAAELMKISKSKAQKIVVELNKELQEKGKVTIKGKVPLSYFRERLGLREEGK